MPTSERPGGRGGSADRAEFFLQLADQAVVLLNCRYVGPSCNEMPREVAGPWPDLQHPVPRPHAFQEPGSSNRSYTRGEGEPGRAGAIEGHEGPWREERMKIQDPERSSGGCRVKTGEKSSRNQGESRQGVKGNRRGMGWITCCAGDAHQHIIVRHKVLAKGPTQYAVG